MANLSSLKSACIPLRSYAGWRLGIRRECGVNARAYQFNVSKITRKMAQMYGGKHVKAWHTNFPL